GDHRARRAGGDLQCPCAVQGRHRRLRRRAAPPDPAGGVLRRHGGSGRGAEMAARRKSHADPASRPPGRRRRRRVWRGARGGGLSRAMAGLCARCVEIPPRRVAAAGHGRAEAGMKLYYYSAAPNSGDVLNTRLSERLLPGCWNPDAGINFSGIGTIVTSAMPEAHKWIVFTSGAGYGAPPAHFGDQRWHVVAVRGPLSAAALD